jgi:hypothetical protein
MDCLVSLIRHELVDSVRGLRASLSPIKPFDWAVIGLGLFALALWCLSFPLAGNLRESDPTETLYEAVCLRGESTSTDQPAWVSPSLRLSPQLDPRCRDPNIQVALAIPFLATLFFGIAIALFVARPEPAARLFSLFCVLYALSAVSVFPAFAGPVLYALTLLAGLFALAVELHFAKVFPQGALTVPSRDRGLKRLIGWPLYVVTGIFALPASVLALNADRVFATIRAVEAAGGNATPEQGLVILGWGFVAALRLLVGAPSWLVASLLLFSTWRRLRRRFALAPSAAIDRGLHQLWIVWVGTVFLLACWAVGYTIAFLQGLALYAGTTVSGGALVAGDLLLGAATLPIVVAVTIALARYELWSFRGRFQRSIAGGVVFIVVAYAATLLQPWAQQYVVALFADKLKYVEGLIVLLGALLFALLSNLLYRVIAGCLDVGDPTLESHS